MKRVIITVIVLLFSATGCGPEEKTPCECTYYCDDGRELESVRVAYDEQAGICELMQDEHACVLGTCECVCDDPR